MYRLLAKFNLAALAALCVLSLMSATAYAGDNAVTHLKIINTKTGHGAVAVPGARVTVDYTGWLYAPDAKQHRGKKFDSSKDHGQPFSFVLGAGQVIKGWDQGVKGMRVGGERTLIIPADMAYGARGAGGVIPPNAALVFDVSLEKVQK